MIAALFVRRDSVSKGLGCDSYDIDRNALTFRGGCPVVAHPPCRAWSRLRHFARPRQGEKELAIWAISQVRKWGGGIGTPGLVALVDGLQSARDRISGSSRRFYFSGLAVVV